MWYEIAWSDGSVSFGDTENAPVSIPFFYPVPGEGIPGIELECIGMDSNFVHKDQLAEANQLLVECEEDLYEADEVNQELWKCLEESEAELEEIRQELEFERAAVSYLAGVVESYIDAVSMRDTDRLDSITDETVQWAMSVLAKKD